MLLPYLKYCMQDECSHLWNHTAEWLKAQGNVEKLIEGVEQDDIRL